MLYIGVMSGTSCDGVDVVLVECEPQLTLKASGFYPYPDTLKNQLLSVIKNQAITVQEYSRLDAILGHTYADCILQFIEENQIDSSSIEAIGLHGQTVFHEPDHQHANTLQLGSAAITAEKTGIQTVANFRQMDLASGGQGAPLAPILHQHLFAEKDQTIAVINLGGIANITYLNNNTVIGFDTGPASCLMDEWYRMHHQGDYDDQGAWAKEGTVDQSLLQCMLNEPYFHAAYPKSTGRELFNLNWLQKKLSTNEASPVNVQRTLLQLTVETLALGINQLPQSVDTIIVCGGGAHNHFLISTLAAHLNTGIKNSADYGLDVDFVEAVLMAWLAMQRVNDNKLDLTSITGASSAALYGVIYR